MAASALANMLAASAVVAGAAATFVAAPAAFATGAGLVSCFAGKEAAGAAAVEPPSTTSGASALDSCTVEVLEASLTAAWVASLANMSATEFAEEAGTGGGAAVDFEEVDAGGGGACVVGFESRVAALAVTARTSDAGAALAGAAADGAARVAAGPAQVGNLLSKGPPCTLPGSKEVTVVAYVTFAVPFVLVATVV